MTGPEHYLEAERLLVGAMRHRVDIDGDWKDSEFAGEEHRIADALVAEAQVHATLAQAAVNGGVK